MNFNSPHLSQANAQEAAGRIVQNLGADPPRDAMQARIAFLSRRFGLEPARAALIAPLAFGGARS